MANLLYLKHSFNASDEELVEHWAENVRRQFFSGMERYEPRVPCDATQIGRFRRRLKIARHKLASAAKRAGINLEQAYTQQGKSLRRKAGDHAYAKQ